jgi:hypothetical protein
MAKTILNLQLKGKLHTVKQNFRAVRLLWRMQLKYLEVSQFI